MARNKKKTTENTLDSFVYVDMYHKNPQNGYSTKWVRKHINEAHGFAQTYNNFNIFQTVQLYQNKVKQEGGDEVNYTPLFFDIDSSRKLATEIKEGKRSKPGLIELGVVTSFELEKFLPKSLLAHVGNFELGIELPDDACNAINILVEEDQALNDLVWKKNLEYSRKDAVQILHYFMEKFNMTEDELRVYFSGSKGFHIIVNPLVMGVQPDANLHRVYKLIATTLESQLGLKSLDTATIYGTRRMLRVVGSIHHKSGLFKTEITHNELKGNVYNLIKPGGIASAPREEVYPSHQTSYNLNERLHEWYQSFVQAYQDTARLEADRVTLKDEVLSQMEGVPVCVEFILARGILKSGDRNKATMVLASYYKDTGKSIGETTEILCEWVKKIPASLTSSSPSEVQASTVGCVKTVYTEDKYHFGCSFIRSLHGERQGRSYEAVPCSGRACPAHEDYAIDQIPPESMHLSQTANADLTGKKVAFNALVSGKMDTPYIVPKKVRYICHHEKFCEKDCIMHDFAGLYEREFHENERFLIEATGQNDNNTKGILFYHSGASCKKVKSEILANENVTELLVVPMADRVKSVKHAEGNFSEVDQDGNEYVSRKIYAVGKPHEIPRSNEHFAIEGFVYAHPKNSMATILTQKHEPLEDSISKFKLTEDVMESFKVFQVQPGEVIDNRIDVIIKDLVDHVTLVRQREEAHIAALLTYHSCLNYYFQGQLEKRGWLETIFVGDSGQAKSLLVDNIMEFSGLGNTASGEGSSRTGLVYRLEQIGERWFITWGSYPLSDRKLIAIDEFSELPAEDFGKITEARTTGVLRVDRAVRTETNARVRLMLLTNPAKARTLASFAHGVESLRSLFHSPADIRRLDLAVFLQTGDVGRNNLNVDMDDPEVRALIKPQVISSEVFRNSILWAWSRSADHIDITRKAMKRILSLADELAQKYGYAQDIPLMEPADLRKKLARMSIALAALLHSTDDTHEKIIVTEEHVSWIGEFYEVVYDNKNARLDVYSAKSKEESELTEEEAETVTQKLEDMDFAANATISVEILELFRKNDILKPVEIIDMLGFEKAEVNNRLAILTKHSMIKRTREGLRKLPKFIEYLNTEQ